MVPSVFSLYYVSLINFDNMDIKSGETKQNVKDSWLQLNKHGNETVQDIYQTKFLMYCFFVWFSIQFLMTVITAGVRETI